MYTLGSDFSMFHRDFVKLSHGEISRLRSLKKLNLKRIEKGLEKYNEDQSKKLKIIDTREQGSVSMNTIIQAEENDYDIDVAIIFDKVDGNDCRNDYRQYDILILCLRRDDLCLTRQLSLLYYYLYFQPYFLHLLPFRLLYIMQEKKLIQKKKHL